MEKDIQSLDSGEQSETKNKKVIELLRTIFVGKQYRSITSITEQTRYLATNYIFILAFIPLLVFGLAVMDDAIERIFINVGMAFLCLLSVFLMRKNVPFAYISILPVSLFAAYCIFLLSVGTYTFWVGVWIFSLPLITIFMCRLAIGLIQSLAALGGIILIFYTPIARAAALPEISIRFIFTYLLILGITIIYELMSIRKDKKEKALISELAYERDITSLMKDNIDQGIFLMDTNLKILPRYSQPLVSILSYYDSDLEGKSFLDILSSSLNAKQLNMMQGYFAMIFAKERTPRVLESINAISEFEYQVDDRTKTLSTKFHLIEQAGLPPVIIGIIKDISREKEFEKELLAQKQAQEMEMKNIFDVIQIDPMVFQDFIEDTESNFNLINATLKDKDMSEKEKVTKFFQSTHSMKSNALILGLESFGKKLHALEDEIKEVSSHDRISIDDVLGLVVKLEMIMQDKDSYAQTIKKIESFKSSNNTDAVLLNSLTKAVEKISGETRKQVQIRAGELDRSILGTKLRKPIKDILFQCVRNSIYHGIEPIDERVQKKKSPQGLLVFNLKKVDDKAELTFSDDGRGLDWRKIKTKYLELHPNAKEVNSNTLLSSIFSPEFTTAEETTTVAGRGIGLSLVKTLVKENNGTINVNSSDSGLTFKFTFLLSA